MCLNIYLANLQQTFLIKKFFFIKLYKIFIYLCTIIFKQIENMKNLIAILVATLGIHTDNYLVMTGCIVIVIYLIVKK